MAPAPLYNRITLDDELLGEFSGRVLCTQATADRIPTLWCEPGSVIELLRYFKSGISKPYAMLYDLTAIDERERRHRDGQPPADFTVVYHLLSFDRNADIRIKVPLLGELPSLPSCTVLWESASWYEREVFDMFGITFSGHRHLRRILMPEYWKGNPLRKEHPARATEMEPFTLTEEAQAEALKQLSFDPAAWGLPTETGEHEYLYLNIGPHHTGTHGVLRLMAQLDGEEIVNLIPEIGFHHRGAEKMGERQSWHSYIPYTDRIDYLAGVMNNFPYCLTVETLAGIVAPDRARVIRIMTAEIFRIISHLAWYGTFAQDLGSMSPVFYMFTDRERAFDVITAITGARMHPGWFRIGGVAQDLPDGWVALVKDFLAYLGPKLHEYDRMVMANPILKARTRGVGVYSREQAIEWGVTGPGLRASGMEWDFRRQRPYGGYDQFEFDIPTAHHGDCYDRALVRVEEMRQSMRIIEQCLGNMPAGPYKADHPLSTPPAKPATLEDIETLITHFLGVSWGPVIPPGEAAVGVEGTKGNNTYYLISDGNTVSYRTRIRTPSFAHLQMLPMLCRGRTIPDLIAVLAALDFVLADVDR